MKFEGNTFVNQEVRLDHHEYIGCTFRNCTMVFAGTGELTFAENTLHGCSFSFDGPASETINFLVALYHEFGPDGRQVVEQTFENIRRRDLPGLPPLR